MRSGQSANQLASLSLDLPAIGNCSPKPYLSSGLLGRTAEDRRRVLYPLVQRAACEAGLPIGLMDAMLIQESRYNPMALSPKGAFSRGQLMPATAKQHGVDRYRLRSEDHTSDLRSLIRIPYAGFRWNEQRALDAAHTIRTR